MNYLYNLSIFLYYFVIKIFSLFNPKAKLWIQGRKNQILPDLKNEKVIWMHCSSLGEFEQGRPVFEELKKKLKGYIFVLSFFSPSGFERIKNNRNIADHILYLPIDLPDRVNIFLDKINPGICIFVKYDFWLNLTREINNRNIKLIFISVLLNNDHIFFSFYYKDFLKEFIKIERIFTQDEKTNILLKNRGFLNTETAGDTRIDRVLKIATAGFQDSIVENFINSSKKTIVCGSTWEKDIEILSNIQNFLTDRYKLIIAPHEISARQTDLIKTKFSSVKISVYSKPDENIESSDILIIDKIGILSRLYRYANLALIGGGFGSGIHNTLEPASYSIPVIFGPKYTKFIEAVNLVDKKAFFSINNSFQLIEVLLQLEKQDIYSESQSQIFRFLEHNKNASVKIVNFIEKLSNEAGNKI